jgi:hypothetical protein
MTCDLAGVPIAKTAEQPVEVEVEAMVLAASSVAAD